MKRELSPAVVAAVIAALVLLIGLIMWETVFKTPGTIRNAEDLPAIPPPPPPPPPGN